jgi:hypothetical protein
MVHAGTAKDRPTASGQRLVSVGASSRDLRLETTIE